MVWQGLEEEGGEEDEEGQVHHLRAGGIR